MVDILIIFGLHILFCHIFIYEKENLSLHYFKLKYLFFFIFISLERRGGCKPFFFFFFFTLTLQITAGPEA